MVLNRHINTKHHSDDVKGTKGGHEENSGVRLAGFVSHSGDVQPDYY